MEYVRIKYIYLYFYNFFQSFESLHTLSSHCVTQVLPAREGGLVDGPPQGTASLGRSSAQHSCPVLSASSWLWSRHVLFRKE